MECYLGTVTMFAFNFTPMYFAQCNGALMSIPQNAALYSLLGTVFGGNGSSNFGLPDLQGRAPVHFGVASGGSTNRAFGVKFGTENVTISGAQLPAHTHVLNETTAGQTVTATAAATVNASTNNAGMPLPTGHYWAAPCTGTTQTYGYAGAKTAGVTMASDAVTVSVTPTFNKANLTIGNAGNGAAVPVATPSLALNFCICTAGLFPSRT